MSSDTAYPPGDYNVPKPKQSTVDHPPHYRNSPSGVECIDVVEWMPFNIGNAVKYLWRAPYKGGDEDYRKAIWYIQRELARIEEIRT